ncbi:MAG: class I SAM-dependent methyltransferase [Amphiplicatus sp.]
MEAASGAYIEQAALWNGLAGRAWVETQDVLDHMFRPLEDLLVEAVPAGSACRVLDVGCGTGAVTLAAARRLAPRGRSVGVDISEPMIAAARARATQEGAQADFIRADAQSFVFESAGFDMILSRFGVMFFDDFVGAFANLRRAAKEGAALRCVVWRGAEENPFMTTAERAAALFLPAMPARRPDAPGQFAFADAGRVRRILEESGWAGIALQPIDVPCAFPEADLVRYFTRLGPLGLILHEADEKTRARIIETVRAAFDLYVRDGEVRFTAACWMVAACAP